METAYLLSGSNLGDRNLTLKDCLSQVAVLGTIQNISKVYESKAWGERDQPDYLNQAIALQTELNPLTLLGRLHEIEERFGRVRKKMWEARPADIDILLFGSVVVTDERIIIPHLYLPVRKFALTPLNEIAPSLVHPVLNKTIAELLAECNDPLEVHVFDEKTISP